MKNHTASIPWEGFGMTRISNWWRQSIHTLFIVISALSLAGCGGGSGSTQSQAVKYAEHPGTQYTQLCQ